MTRIGLEFLGEVDYTDNMIGTLLHAYPFTRTELFHYNWRFVRSIGKDDCFITSTHSWAKSPALVSTVLWPASFPVDDGDSHGLHCTCVWSECDDFESYIALWLWREVLTRKTFCE